MGVFTRLIDSRALKLATCFVAFVVYHQLRLYSIQRKHPLAGPKEGEGDDADDSTLQLKALNAWTQAWLHFLALEHYGVCACVGLIVCYTEIQSGNRVRALCWTLACIFLGTPVCCLYVALRLRDHGTLALVGGATVLDEFDGLLGATTGASPATPSRERKPSK